jgi:hypothetical protein
MKKVLIKTEEKRSIKDSLMPESLLRRFYIKFHDMNQIERFNPTSNLYSLDTKHLKIK